MLLCLLIGCCYSQLFQITAGITKYSLAKLKEKLRHKIEIVGNLITERLYMVEEKGVHEYHATGSVSRPECIFEWIKRNSHGVISTPNFM